MYQQYASQETCVLTQAISTDCTWNCKYDIFQGKYVKCSSSKEKSCITCHGKLYSYQATASDKCGEQIITESSTKTDECPETVKTLDTETNCWVLSCGDAEFVLTHPDSLEGAGILWIVFGSILMAIPCFCFCIVYSFCGSQIMTNLRFSSY